MKPEVLVTGASGFVGNHVVRRLLARQIPVRVLLRKTSSTQALQGMPVERVSGDLKDAASIRNAVRGCRFVYHVAADYRLWTRNPKELYDSNVTGTRNVLEAAWAEKVDRIVYTSSVAALGLSHDGSPATEETPTSLDVIIGHYKKSKYLAEQEALKLARQGCPVVIVNPSTPIGSWDIKPTQTGQIIVDFLNGKMPGFVDTGLNLVDVEDVAEGHLLAMERGKVGERYILGNKNVSLKEMLEILARLSHRPAPRMKVPWAVAYAAGFFSSTTAWVTGKPPAVPLDGVRMARKKMYFDPQKAVRQLGLPQNPVEQALEKAVNWFRQHGYAAV